MIKDEALKLALEALDSKYIVGCSEWRVQQLKAITAIKEALAQPAQEPVAYQCKGIPRKGCNYLTACDCVCNKCGEIHHHHQMVANFTFPPQRPWVGLTDEEISQFDVDPIEAKQLIAKLKEKNGL